MTHDAFIKENEKITTLLQEIYDRLGEVAALASETYSSGRFSERLYKMQERLQNTIAEPLKREFKERAKKPAQLA